MSRHELKVEDLPFAISLVVDEQQPLSLSHLFSVKSIAFSKLIGNKLIVADLATPNALVLFQVFRNACCTGMITDGSSIWFHASKYSLYGELIIMNICPYVLDFFPSKSRMHEIIRHHLNAKVPHYFA